MTIEEREEKDPTMHNVPYAHGSNTVCMSQLLQQNIALAKLGFKL